MKSLLRFFLSVNYFTIGLFLILFFTFLYSLQPAFIKRREYLSQDFRFTLAGERTPGNDVAIIAIDEKSIDSLGRWPWSRKTMAELVDTLNDYRVKVIAFDIVFSSPEENSAYRHLNTLQKELKEEGLHVPEVEGLIQQHLKETDNDELLRLALKHSHKAVLGYFFYFSDEETKHLKEEELEQYLQNISRGKYSGIKKAPGVSLFDVPLLKAYAVESNIRRISSATKRGGYFNFVPEIDGSVRKVPLIVQYQNRVEMEGEQDYLFAPLSVTALRKYLKAPILFSITEKGVEKVAFSPVGRPPILIPTDASGNLLINYLGPRKTFPHYSAVDVLNKHVLQKNLKGRIVLIGPTATAIEDLRVTPFEKNFPGVEIHATIIDNILRGDFLQVPHWSSLYTLIVMALSVVVMGIAAFFCSPLLEMTITLAVIFMHAESAIQFFIHKHLVIDMVYPVLATVSASILFTLYRVSQEEKQKQFFHNAFGQYLAPTVIEEIVKNPDKLRLGGERKVLTAFFSDVQGFSTISENLSPEELVELLNDYLTRMTTILLKHGGTVDKYEGDAIIAFFGAPVSFDDHAERACLTAIEMQKELQNMRKELKKEGRPVLKARIGINTGPMVVGNMGSSTRMDYTIMGDAVNLASRLEGVNKQYGTFTMISEYTQKELSNNIVTRKLDIIRVVGKREPVTIYEVVDKKENITEETKKLITLFHKGREEYALRNWEEAAAYFKEALAVFPEDPASLCYISRCEAFLKNPPPEGWDGVYEMTSK